MNTREMLDQAASENYRMAAENARLQQEAEALRAALIECGAALSAQTRKTLSPETTQVLENIRPATRKLKAKAAAQS